MQTRSNDDANQILHEINLFNDKHLRFAADAVISIPLEEIHKTGWFELFEFCFDSEVPISIFENALTKILFPVMIMNIGKLE